MSEPAVTLTDYLLAVLCAGLVVRTLGIRTGEATFRGWFLLLFTTVGLAAALGRLMDDPARRLQFGKCSRLKAENEFSEAAVVERVLTELYELEPEGRV